MLFAAQIHVYFTYLLTDNATTTDLFAAAEESQITDGIVEK